MPENDGSEDGQREYENGKWWMWNADTSKWEEVGLVPGALAKRLGGENIQEQIDE